VGIPKRCTDQYKDILNGYLIFNATTWSLTTGNKRKLSSRQVMRRKQEGI
jgi:hypothetical protein